MTTANKDRIYKRYLPIVVACSLALSACMSKQSTFMPQTTFNPNDTAKPSANMANSTSKPIAKPTVDRDLIRQASALAVAETRSLAVKNEIPTITAVGYAAMSTQPSKNKSERRLMAIRAARILALRQLTEQVHGIKIDGDATVLDAVVQSDTVRTRVSGIIRGARTTRVSPVGTDNYEVAMELDRTTLRNIVEEALKAQ
jgi:hypothetical protein